MPRSCVRSVRGVGSAAYASILVTLAPVPVLERRSWRCACGAARMGLTLGSIRICSLGHVALLVCRKAARPWYAIAEGDLGGQHCQESCPNIHNLGGLDSPGLAADRRPSTRCCPAPLQAQRCPTQVPHCCSKYVPVPPRRAEGILDRRSGCSFTARPRAK